MQYAASAVRACATRERCPTAAFAGLPADVRQRRRQLRPRGRRHGLPDRVHEQHAGDLRLLRSRGRRQQRRSGPAPIATTAASLASAAARSACSRSAIRSSTCSMPTERRTSPSPIPSAWRRSGGIDAWVMIAGCSASDSTPPSDSAQVKTRSARQKIARAPERVPRLPRSAKLTMPPKPDICRRASACCGCDAQARVEHRARSRGAPPASARPRARSAWCRSMRTASVLVPRSTRKLSNAGWLPPMRVLQERQRARAARRRGR